MIDESQTSPGAATDPMAEIEAMTKVATALYSLGIASRHRVLDWAIRFFKAAPGRAGGSEVASPDPGIGNAALEGHTGDLASFFASANPETESEKALVVGYWLQEQGADEFEGFRVNSELTHLGHRVANITQAMTALMKAKPQQVVQTRKEGKSKQARKRYKLTVEGRRKVKLLIEKASES